MSERTAATNIHGMAPSITILVNVIEGAWATKQVFFHGPQAYCGEKTTGLTISGPYNIIASHMEKYIYKTNREMAVAAAAEATAIIKKALKEQGHANIILATGTSQIEMIENLVVAAHVEWSTVTMFHLDEYIGLKQTHPASFRKYLKERFVDKVAPLKAVHFINGDAKDPLRECHRIGGIIAKHPIDAACVGIGENGHLAFNDPPADFETEETFIVVDLDERCRRQQLGEGWFEHFDQVPQRAISMSIRQIMKSRCIIVTVPERRKAEAVRNALEKDITPMCPASILQKHKNCKIFLDEDAASLLSQNP
jgi:glucosamine-6-phosphate deaminase